jgi:hypothetical protein
MTITTTTELEQIRTAAKVLAENADKVGDRHSHGAALVLLDRIDRIAPDVQARIKAVSRLESRFEALIG